VYERVVSVVVYLGYWKSLKAPSPRGKCYAPKYCCYWYTSSMILIPWYKVTIFLPLPAWWRPSKRCIKRHGTPILYGRLKLYHIKAILFLLMYVHVIFCVYKILFELESVVLHKNNNTDTFACQGESICALCTLWCQNARTVSGTLRALSPEHEIKLLT
jgi:hypothetical protein